MMHMKHIQYLIIATAALFFAGCNTWQDHFGEAEISTSADMTLYAGDVAGYLSEAPGLGTMRKLFADAGLTEQMTQGHPCTVVVCEDQHITSYDATQMAHPLFAANNLSSIPVPASSLKPGQGIFMQSGKNLWVTVDEAGRYYLNDREIRKVVKATNGYIYYVSAIISVQPSVYDYIQGLGDDYSLFKSFLHEFEENWFDADASTPVGIDAMGNIVYKDSVIAVRNTLMDRYTENGLDYWNMQSESFQSTVFLPDNTLLQHADETAHDSIPLWLNRSATAQDSLKFRRWIVSSCFVDRKLSPREVASDVEGQFACVGGYVREIDAATDKETFKACDAAQWKPSVQKADVGNPVNLSNGVVYRLTDYKIPNHIVIWRVKARFYQVWAALSAAQQGWNATTMTPTEGGYFRWNHWAKPLVVNDAQSPFELSSTLPTMYYHVLTAEPDAAARADSLQVSVDYDGLLYNEQEPKAFGLKEVSLPAGEYYLRMGFKHSLTYSICIWFCGADETFGPDNCLVEDMSLIATGSNFHFDRGGAMEGLDFYGSESIGYPEYYDWRWWFDQDPVQYQKASAYDTDGYQVAIVNLKKSGNFKIKIASNDNAALYGNGRQDRTKSDVNQLMMYHWCLRPTIYNY